MKYLNSKKIVLVFLTTLLLSLIFGVSFAATEATDAQGNKYILNDDGTYKKLENAGLSNKEVASRVVAAIKSYKKIMQKLPMKDGVVTNEILVAQGQIFILGAMEAAKKYCEMN